MPDKYTDRIYQYLQQEVDIRAKGSLPYVTLLGPCRTFETLPLEEVVPAFRFWVPQDVASGAYEGHTVDDLTSSASNSRTRIFEKLELLSLDDFVAIVKRVAEFFPDSAWGSREFIKHDIRKVSTGAGL